MPSGPELPRGTPLWEKLLQELSPGEFQRAREHGYDSLRTWLLSPEERSRDPETCLISKLISGELVATGIYLPIDPHRPRKIIPPELWDHVLILFDKSELLLEHK